MGDFDPQEVSGIAGTHMEDTLSFDVAIWLTRCMPGKVEIAWDHYDPDANWAPPARASCPCSKTMPTLKADTPWRRWLETAAGKKDSDPAWLIQRFADLPLPPNQKAELYESLRVPLRWHLGNSRITRTRKWKTRPQRLLSQRSIHQSQ